MLQNILIGIVALTALSQAGPEKVKTILCEPSLVYKCTVQGCETIKVVNIDKEARQYFKIDTEKKTLVGKIGNSTVDIAKIFSRQGDENTFVFFGMHTESKHDWILRIDKKTGRMVLLATNVNLDGFTVYGTCKWEAGQ